MNPKLKKIIIFFFVLSGLFLTDMAGLNSLQNAAANEKIILKGQIALQGRTGIDDAKPTVLQVRIKKPEGDKVIFRDDYVATTQNVQKNDNIYFFEIDLTGKIEPGNYDILVKEWHYLDSLKNIDLSIGENNIDFRELKAGDMNNDDYIGNDDEILGLFMGQQVGDISLPPYPSLESPIPWHADINNDGIINTDDQSLYLKNIDNVGSGIVGLHITKPTNVILGHMPLGWEPIWAEEENEIVQWTRDNQWHFSDTVKIQYCLNPVPSYKCKYLDLTGEISNSGEYYIKVINDMVSSHVILRVTVPDNSFYYAPAMGIAQVSVLPKREVPSYPTGSNVLVVYNNVISGNSNFASQLEGKEIAEYYLFKRPGANLMNIDIPDSVRVGTYGEEISRANYEQYIRDPIIKWLDANTNKDIRYIVLTKGVPLKILREANLQYTEASVDSELATLYSDYNGIYDPLLTTYFLLNPYYYYQHYYDEFEENYFKDDGFKYLFQPNYFYNYFPYNQAADLKINYLVTRLDGYSVADVKAMIDRAVGAKKGDYYWILDDGGVALDRMMGIDPTRVLNYKWAKTVLEEDFGLADYVVYEDLTQPIYSNPKNPEGPVIAYVGYGVYDGSPNNAITNLFDFNLAPGALYSSYESFNAWGFHDKDQAPSATDHTQLGEWIAIGGTGGVGNVYEPYSSAIANEAIWMPAYAAGYPLADAFYLSIPYFSWTQVVIGDPLTSIRILPNQVPTITGLTVTSAGGQSPFTIGFTGQAQDPDGSITNYFWDFGDGGTSTDQNPNHIYNNPGTYTAIFAVTDNNGATSTKNITIVVTSLPETPPADTTPPLSPSDFKANVNDSQITLSWVNPKDSDFVKVKILRKEDNYPANANDGKIVYEGDKTSYIDTGLINDKIYYYAIFASDNALNWSSADFVQTAPKANITSEPPITLITKEEKINLLKTQINSLIEQILILQTELKKMSGIAYENIPVNFKFSKYLKHGFKNDEVKYLQIVLKIETDGIFGGQTESAVKEFQKSHGLVADGIVGPKTRAELNNIF